MGILVKREQSLPTETKRNHLKMLLALEAKALEEDPDAFVAGSPEADERTDHYHCNGAYVRTYSMKKGEYCTGEVHRFACINILLQGRVQVIQSDGEYIMEAPLIYISEPGEKKALRALEDTIFCNVHATEETDQTKLREHFTVPPHEFLLENK
jgi:hypothetical protein